MTENEIQRATVEVNVSLTVAKGDNNRERIEAINKAVKRALEKGGGIEYRGVRGATELHEVETAEETAERKMAEAEGEALARAERAYERHLEERGSRYR